MCAFNYLRMRGLLISIFDVHGLVPFLAILNIVCSVDVRWCFQEAAWRTSESKIPHPLPRNSIQWWAHFLYANTFVLWNGNLEMDLLWSLTVIRVWGGHQIIILESLKHNDLSLEFRNGFISVFQAPFDTVWSPKLAELDVLSLTLYWCQSRSMEESISHISRSFNLEMQIMAYRIISVQLQVFSAHLT